jgi:hypothetical protein
LRETADALVVEVVTPAEIDLSRMSARRITHGVEIRLPHVLRTHRINDFHPEATGV